MSKKKKKVFCKNCRYYACTGHDYFGWTEYCKKEIFVKINATYLADEHYSKEHLMPSVHNKKNDCQYYVDKFHWW